MEANRIARLLPEVFQRGVEDGKPLAALLSAMEALHAPAEHHLGAVDRFFSVHEAPDDFLPLLARWLDLHRITEPRRTGMTFSDWRPAALLMAPGNLRALIAIATHLSQWRGTAHGMKLFLETATGHAGFDIDEHLTDQQGLPLLYHIHVWAPGLARAQQALIERIIEQEKPAYVTSTLGFRPSSDNSNDQSEDDDIDGPEGRGG